MVQCSGARGVAVLVRPQGSVQQLPLGVLDAQLFLSLVWGKSLMFSGTVFYWAISLHRSSNRVQFQGARVWQQCYFTVQLLAMGGSSSVVEAMGLVSGNYITLFLLFLAVQAAMLIGRAISMGRCFANSSEQERCL